MVLSRGTSQAVSSSQVTPLSSLATLRPRETSVAVSFVGTWTALMPNSATTDRQDSTGVLRQGLRGPCGARLAYGREVGRRAWRYERHKE